MDKNVKLFLGMIAGASRENTGRIEMKVRKCLLPLDLRKS
jgi:hypothetical protein